MTQNNEIKRRLMPDANAANMRIYNKLVNMFLI